MEGNVADDMTMTTDDKSKEGVKSDTADGATEQKQDGDNSNDTTASNVEVEGDYNDGVANDFDNDNYGATTSLNDSDSDDDDDDHSSAGPHASETGVDRHLAHPDNPHMEQTHEGEHRFDHGDIASLKITRSTKLFAF